MNFYLFAPGKEDDEKTDQSGYQEQWDYKQNKSGEAGISKVQRILRKTFLENKERKYEYWFFIYRQDTAGGRFD